MADPVLMKVTIPYEHGRAPRVVDAWVAGIVGVHGSVYEPNPSAWVDERAYWSVVHAPSGLAYLTDLTRRQAEALAADLRALPEDPSWCFTTLKGVPRDFLEAARPIVDAHREAVLTDAATKSAAQEALEVDEFRRSIGPWASRLNHALEQLRSAQGALLEGRTDQAFRSWMYDLDDAFDEMPEGLVPPVSEVRA